LYLSVVVEVEVAKLFEFLSKISMWELGERPRWGKVANRS